MLISVVTPVQAVYVCVCVCVWCVVCVCGGGGAKCNGERYRNQSWCVSWQAVSMVTRFCNTVFPIFEKKFAMAMLFTGQVIAFCSKFDSEYQIRYFECICICENT